jgi:hypothetical protein
MSNEPGFTAARAIDFQPLAFGGDRTPDDAAALLPDAAATKMIAIGQCAADLLATVPSHEQVQEVRLEALGYKNRISDLTRHRSEGGFEQDPSAPQVLSEQRKLERAEKELARLVELKEVRAARWSTQTQLHRSVSDWVLRGIPGDCTLDVIEDAPVSELMTKADGGRVEAAIERHRLRQRELAAERHRVNSQQWPILGAEADARALIERLADAGRPNLENAIEHNLPITFATTRLTSQVYNIVNSPGAIAYAEMPDAIGLICWMFRDQLLAQISAGFREIGDDKNALDERQRAEMLVTIDADGLAAERGECALIWAAAERGEVIDFRPTTSPQAVLGVALRTVPRAAPPPTSPGHGYNLIGGR